jgi:predicted O-methyltransferase YrrM
MNKVKNLDVLKIMNELDLWVSNRDNGKYLPAYSKVAGDRVSIIDDEILSLGLLHEDHGIQQVRDEIKGFVETLIENNKTKSILEIGLGHCGSTHFLWRQIFDRVVTIEKSYDRIREFSKNMRSYYGKWVFDDDISRFIIGFSNENMSVSNSRKLYPNGVQVLFIDGDHRYEAVLTDWLLYAPLVEKGGIIAFHDSAFSAASGAPKLLEELSNGKHDGIKRNIHQIIKSDLCGIGYYFNV